MSPATVDAYTIRLHELHHNLREHHRHDRRGARIRTDRLGHVDISVTLNTYTHVLPDKRTEVAKKIEEAIV